MGLRSMKVKRLREEKAARARELWMKAESAAAGKSERDKKMLESAIKIQVTHANTLISHRSSTSKSDTYGTVETSIRRSNVHCDGAVAVDRWYLGNRRCCRPPPPVCAPTTAMQTARIYGTNGAECRTPPTTSW